MVDGQLPPERNLPAATRHGDDAVVFGGLGLDGGYLRDVYRVDGTTLAFEELRPRWRPAAGTRRRGTHRRPRQRSGPALRRHRHGDAFDDTWQLTLP